LPFAAALLFLVSLIDYVSPDYTTCYALSTLMIGAPILFPFEVLSLALKLFSYSGFIPTPKVWLTDLSRPVGPTIGSSKNLCLFPEVMPSIPFVSGIF
jgi:hypothetical protein